MNNCPRCGNIVAPGSSTCPYCNTTLQFPMQNQGYAMPNQPQTMQQGYSQQQYPQQQYPQPQYPQPQYPQPQYPQQQYQQPQYQQQQYQQPTPQQNVKPSTQQRFMSAFELYLNFFTDPSLVLRRTIEQHNITLISIILALGVLVSFLTGMLMTRNLIYGLFVLIIESTGLNQIQNTANIMQSVNYLTSGLYLSVGALFASLHAVMMLLPTLVAAIYLRFIKKIQISLELMANITAIATVPTISFLALASVLSFISNVLVPPLLICSVIISYLQLEQMIMAVQNRPEWSLKSKILYYSICFILAYLLIGLIAGLWMPSILTQIMTAF